ncbi:MAG: hydrolase, partial [Bradyrhizobium icense]
MPDVLAAVAELAPGIRARAAEIEKARRLPADLARSLARSGAFRMLVPREIGGLELPPDAALRAIEAAGAADASVGWCVMIGATTGLNAAYLPREVAREIFGSPETIAGGVFAPMGKAVRDGDDYVLNGRWQWASGSANCDWLLAGAIVFENGAPRKLANGMADDRKLIFPAKQAVLNDTWHVTGLCGTGSGEMVVSELRVPARYTTSYLESAPSAAGALYAFPVFGLLALGIAAVALGNARAAIDDLVELAGAKQPLGSRRTLAERGS